MRFYLGLDAGGTKTFCLIGDETGRIVGFGRAGTGNYEYKGVEPAYIENERAIKMALDDAGMTLSDIAGIGMGVAGADLPEDYEMLEERMYTPLLGDTPRAFRNDSMAGLRGGTKHPYGVVIACGTGCVCAGRNRTGEEARVGGLGEEFGDECTGTSLGLAGLRAIWQARDEIIPKTRLTQHFVAHAGCADQDELFYKLYRQELTYDDLQPMAKLVFDAALEGDAKACDILAEGGRYLGAMVTAVARHLQMVDDVFEVVLAGSVFKGSSPVLADAMRAVIRESCPRAEAVPPVFEPVVGALLMGMELDLTVDDAVYENLTQELAAAAERYGVTFNAS
jgi:N-acetylglucosamine kinase-like BadF-type ATPase